MRLLTWNICHGASKARSASIVAALVDHAPDVIVLTEYRHKPAVDLPGQLRARGWEHQVATSPGPRVNGILVAARQAFAVHPPASALPQRWLDIAFPTSGVSITAVHIPSRGDRWDKQAFWEEVIARARSRSGHQHLFIGDFNTGRPSDAEGGPFAFPEYMDHMEQAGFTDVWRHHHPAAREFTWYSQTGNGFRLDYLFASASMLPKVRRVCHSQDERERKYSDHALLVADLDSP